MVRSVHNYPLWPAACLLAAVLLVGESASAARCLLPPVRLMRCPPVTAPLQGTLQAGCAICCVHLPSNMPPHAAPVAEAQYASAAAARTGGVCRHGCFCAPGKNPVCHRDFVTNPPKNVRSARWPCLVLCFSCPTRPPAIPDLPLTLPIPCSLPFLPFLLLQAILISSPQLFCNALELELLALGTRQKCAT